MCSRKRGARQCSRQHNNLHSIPQNWIFRPRKNQVKQSKVFWFWNQKRIWMCFLFLWRTVIECEGSRQYIGQRQTHQKIFQEGLVYWSLQDLPKQIFLYRSMPHTPKNMWQVLMDFTILVTARICKKIFYILYWSLTDPLKTYFKSFAGFCSGKFNEFYKMGNLIRLTAE